MKKLLTILVAASLCLVLAGNAEARTFGVKAGVNLTSLNFEKGTPGALGYSVGVTWQKDLSMGFTIQPDLIYHLKTTRLSNISKKTFGLGYIELPVNIQWGVKLLDKKIRAFAQFSPFIGYAVSQKGVAPTVQDNAIYDEDGGILADASKAVNKWLNINRFSYGAGLGLGVQLWGAQLTAQYCWNFGSLSNAKGGIKKSDFSNRNFGGYAVTLAFLFGGKNKN